MNLTFYELPGWRDNIRPAPRERDWMDATPHRMAYRCLPMTMANAHGWEILNPVPFEMEWNGDLHPAGLVITPLSGDHTGLPTSHFGSGVVTWNVHGLFRTPPGWNLWVSGSPNQAKDGVAPLSGVVETDWSSSTFTMNWKATRPGRVRFDAGEPFCFVFPVQRGVVDRTVPRLEPIDADPQLNADYSAWADSRFKFNEMLQRDPPADQRNAWQKHYMRGQNLMSGPPPGEAGHQTKVLARQFVRHP